MLDDQDKKIIKKIDVCCLMVMITMTDTEKKE